MNSFHALPGKAEVGFCHPVSSENMTPREMDKLSAVVRQVMQEALSAQVPAAAPTLTSERVPQ
jgi:hypothetical protein